MIPLLFLWTLFAFRWQLSRTFSIRQQLSMQYNTFVKVRSAYQAPCTLQADTGVSLTSYMQLPVEQYVCIEMPLNATLERMEGNIFRLIVPPVRFFHLDVSPMLMCEVSQAADYVEIISRKCILSGSKYVESLNGCFEIFVRTRFNWQDRPDHRAIISNSAIDVKVDPPAPFKLFGKTVLEATGNLAMSIALRQIENSFVKALSRDYHRWANDENYRKERAKQFS